MFETMHNALSAVRAYTRKAAVQAHDPSSGSPRAAAASSGSSAAAANPAPAGPAPTDGAAALPSSERAIQANLQMLRASDKTLGVLIDTLA